MDSLDPTIPTAPPAYLLKLAALDTTPDPLQPVNRIRWWEPPAYAMCFAISVAISFTLLYGLYQASCQVICFLVTL